ncbi:hypothetical protein L1999_09585 [Neobacillus drentensis]|uniref:hypothetical protein n=1 Tax=Neobacillus drentensis TaxID=220684 RepID=UPI001F336A18|nr:hypothetical protein [Neobacillus drentensis]ULT58753.1 hypothetical protein L1999_09585 [Neobacillus drentensis]
MDKLHKIFNSIMEDSDKIIKESQYAENPLAILFRTVLEEQKDTCENLIEVLQRKEQDFKTYKKDLSILYYDDSVADSTFRAWGRAITWQDENNAQHVNDLDLLFQRIKKSLKEGAKELEVQFGPEKIKYAVPEVYLPKTQREGGK